MLKKLQKLIDFVAALLRIERKPKEKKKRGTDDIYPMW